MAVTVRTYNISEYWTTGDIIDTLETALKDVGYHQATQTGTILTFTNTAGTTILAEKGKRYLVTQASTNGSGTLCTFDVVRNATTGAVATVTLVNGGENYAATNTLVISGADIGGTSPTDDITVTVSTVSGSQGSTSTWHDVDSASPKTWGVCGVNIDKTKKMGQTYYSFFMSGVTLYIRSGPGFQSATNVFNGVAGLDYFSTNAITTTTQQAYSQVIGTSVNVPLVLKTYQSGIDNKFVVFQFSEQTKYGRIFRTPFFLSNYNTAVQPWSLNDCFTGGIYEIGRLNAITTNDCAVFTRAYAATMGKRQGEWGYGSVQGTFANAFSILGYYESLWGKRNIGNSTTFTSVYHRTLFDGAHSSLEYNPIITNIPICNSMIPVPYTIPEDFGVTEVINSNSIAYENLIKVGSTEYTILQFASNLIYGAAMAFVAKTKD